MGGLRGALLSWDLGFAHEVPAGGRRPAPPQVPAGGRRPAPPSPRQPLDNPFYWLGLRPGKLGQPVSLDHVRFSKKFL